MATAPSGATLRAAPLHEATAVGTLPYGVTALVVARQAPRASDGADGFVQLRVPGRSDAVWVEEAAVEPAFPTSALRTVEGDRRHQGRMPLRDAPDAEATPFTSLDDGDTVHLLEVQTPWARVLHEESHVVGWLPADSLDDVTGNRNWFFVRVSEAVDDRFMYAREGWVNGVDLLQDASALGAVALSPHELHVELEYPTPYFLSLVALPVARPVPRRAVERYGANWTEPSYIVTNGPFVVEERQRRRRVVLGRAQSYHGASRVELERVHFHIVPDAQVALDLFRAGYLDALLGGGGALAFREVLSRSLEYSEAPALASFFLRLNQRVVPLQDLRVRQALSLAIDKERLVSRLGGRNPLSAWTLVPPGIDQYPSVAKAYYDPFEAKRLLAEAGYPNGRGFPLVELLLSTDEELRFIGIPLQRQWREILGIDVSLSLLDIGEVRRRTSALQYDLARSGWMADYADPSTFLELWR
ncbi:MAG: ABC transporter substrate-binding protein, partial [Myxococcota bacterium]